MIFSPALLSFRLLPIVVIDSPEEALRLAETLLKAGLPVMEVTLRTDRALASIRAVAQRFPEMLMGAGTILHPEQIPQAQEAGAIFGVAPGSRESVIAAAHAANWPFLPGVITPSEIEQTLAWGCDVLKVFPVEPAGGSALIKALTGPYGPAGIRFVPTGGITAATATGYLALASVAAIGGSWFVERSLVSAGRFDEIEKRTREALQIAKGVASLSAP